MGNIICLQNSIGFDIVPIMFCVEVRYGGSAVWR